MQDLDRRRSGKGQNPTQVAQSHNSNPGPGQHTHLRGCVEGDVLAPLPDVVVDLRHVRLLHESELHPRGPVIERWMWLWPPAEAHPSNCRETPQAGAGLHPRSCCWRAWTQLSTPGGLGHSTLCSYCVLGLCAQPLGHLSLSASHCSCPAAPWPAAVACCCVLAACVMLAAVCKCCRCCLCCDLRVCKPQQHERCTVSSVNNTSTPA